MLPETKTDTAAFKKPTLGDVAEPLDPEKKNSHKRRERKARQAIGPPKIALLSTSKMAEKFSVCMRTIDRWLEDKILPEPKRINGRKFWPADTEPKSDAADRPSPARHLHEG